MVHSAFYTRMLQCSELALALKHITWNGENWHYYPNIGARRKEGKVAEKKRLLGHPDGTRVLFNNSQDRFLSHSVPCTHSKGSQCSQQELLPPSLHPQTLGETAPVDSLPFTKQFKDTSALPGKNTHCSHPSAPFPRAQLLLPISYSTTELPNTQLTSSLRSEFASSLPGAGP